MSWLGDPIMAISSSLCVFLLIGLIKIFQKLWWNPTRLQSLLASQGIKGPPYRLIHGNNKETSYFRKEAMSRPKGLSHDVFCAILPHMHSWTKIYGKNFLQWDGLEPVLVITEPELCKEILNNKDNAFPKSKPHGYIKKLLGDGLVTTPDGEKWAKLRKLANHTFHGNSLKSMIPAMVASTETMLKGWKNHEGEEIEVFEEFRLLTSDVISRTAFGSSYLEGKNIFDLLFKISSLSMKFVSFKPIFPGFSKFLRFSGESELEKLEKAIHDSIMKIIKARERKAVNGEEDGFGRDFLGLLLEAHHDTNDNQRISVDNVVDECKTLYLAGHESTATLLAWTVFLLAHHTDWQEEARKEVLQLFGKQTPNPDGIAKLKTMSMILNESLRLYAPVLGIVKRKVEKEVRLGNFSLPANLELAIFFLAVHYDPQIWGQDAQLFKPERFSEGVAKATKDNLGAFLPFGLGPRICVGFNFATTEAKIALSMILQRYSFTLSPAYVHSPSQYLTIRPQHGVQVILHSL
ncbi:putative cytochrome P450 [Rosa chinensis]|uniref:Putative cytochrome P450 n=1 Tax=Rosa chinensis TaxID=74649 RepID=A0A2P6R2C1_ROSCH|nr:cytochrome P450 CYP749A22 [Rosa chinensis]PRQ40577.1 putative cytochrome P450 [Rosa chinensis]